MSRNGHSKTRRSQPTNPRRGKQQTARNTSNQMTRAEQPGQSMASSSSPSSGSSAKGSSLLSMASSAMTRIKSNPMPYALAGVGVACAGAGLTWLLISSAKSMTDEAGKPMALPQRIQSSVQDATSSVKRASRAANDKVSQIAHDAMATSRNLEQSVEQAVREHPLAIGAALLATGAAIGLAIPRSSFENTWLGRERDQVVSSAQRLAKGAVQKVESLAKQVGNSVSSNSVAHA